MSEISNADIYNAISKMSGDIGRLEGKFDSHAQALAAHVADDKVTDAAVATALQTLQLSHARQKGFMAAMSMVGTAIGVGVGYLVDVVVRGHGQ